MSTYQELLQTAKEMLKQQGVTDADVDAWYLLAHVFRIRRIDYYIHEKEPAPDEGSSIFRELVKKRSEHIPLQQLTGVQDFMGLEFEVNEDVLIPRLDTECLALEVLKVCEGKSVLDMCTGSGCIIISLSKLGRLKKAVGADISDKALSIAAKNAVKLEAVTEFIKSDLFERVEGSFDIIVSNPPYIPTGEINSLMPEVREHEPLLALDAGEDGLEFYRRISAESKKHLNKGGYIFYEIGYNQGEDVKLILTTEGFSDVIVRKDLSGLNRVVSARWL